MVKSFAVNPSIGLSLSLTVTVCTISVCPVRNVGGDGCWANTTLAATVTETHHEATRRKPKFSFSCLRVFVVAFSESQSDAGLNLPHRVRLIRQPELLAADDCIRTEKVTRFRTLVASIRLETEPAAPRERPRHPAFNPNCAARSPSSVRRCPTARPRSVSRGIRVVAPRSILRQPRQVCANRARHRGPGDGGERNRRQQAAAGVELLARDRPSLEERALHASQQRPAGDTNARRALNWAVTRWLIEIRRRPFGVEIQPVLRDRAAAEATPVNAPASSIAFASVLHHGREAVAETTPTRSGSACRVDRPSDVR